ncbi:Hypothetical_protein [Hexamita inflata]|uniref:Hypothetical_protein n=1 Tax=Hexamita inflata TaxID=28002 RepID=A0AA86NTK3_9EUKA|nr:Hypothetical protein HINF_LOCUS12773 [Hexamita inflata]
MDKYRMNKIQQPASLVQAINQRVSPVKQIPTIDDILQETKQDEFHGVRFNTVKQNIVQQSKIPHYSDTQHFKPIQPNLHYKPQDVSRPAPTQPIQQQTVQNIQSYESLALSQKPVNPQPTQNTTKKQHTPPQNNTQLPQKQQQVNLAPKNAPFEQKIGQQALPSQQMHQNDMNSILEQRKQQILQQARIREQKRAMSVSAVNELTKSQNQILYQNKLQNQLNINNNIITNNIISNKQESILNNKQLQANQSKLQKVEVTFKVKQSPEKDETFESSTDILQSYRNLQVSAIPKEKKFNISENKKEDPFQKAFQKTERFKTNQINQNELFEADSPEQAKKQIHTFQEKQIKLEQQNEVKKQQSPTKMTYVSSLNSDLDFLEERAFSAQQKKTKKSGAEELLEEENKMLKKIIKDNKPKVNVMKIKQLEINANQLKKKIQMLEMEME